MAPFANGHPSAAAAPSLRAIPRPPFAYLRLSRAAFQAVSAQDEVDTGGGDAADGVADTGICDAEREGEMGGALDAAVVGACTEEDEGIAGADASLGEDDNAIGAGISLIGTDGVSCMSPEGLETAGCG